MLGRYVCRRFMWWWKWAFQRRLIKEKVAEKGWLCGMEKRMLQKLVIRFWKQGWKVSVKAVRLMGLHVVRESDSGVVQWWQR